MADLRYRLAEDDLATDAVLRWVFETIGVDAVREPSAADPVPATTIFRDGSEASAPVVWIPHRPGEVIWSDLLAGTVPEAADGRVPFDIIGAIGSLLGDEVHASLPGDALDRHGRLCYAASFPARHGFGDRPIVNDYVAYLAGLISEHLGVQGRPRWPDGKTAAIGLSHDVDMPDKYAFLESAIRPWRLRRSPRTYARTAVSLARARGRDRRPNDYWTFGQVMETERRSGASSTFFFATVPFHAPLGAGQDVAYDVRQARYRSVIRRLLGDGFDIGLHASYGAFEDAARLVAEREVLVEIADSEVPGVRHHYWHLGPDIARTLRAHEAAGFQYDSSLAFNDHVGFRRSVALPFHPFDHSLGRRLRTLQLPTFCMDGNLFYTSADVDRAVATVERLVDQIVVTAGFGAIDWHIQASYPANAEYEGWGVAYQEILRSLATRRDVWLSDLGSIERWVRARSADLRR